MDDDAIEAFDHAFDDGVRALVDELRRLTAEHMREEVERFACALQATKRNPDFSSTRIPCGPSLPHEESHLLTVWCDLRSIARVR